VFFRFFQGISIGILYTAPIALMPAVFPGQVEKAMGMMVGISGLGLALGPVLGGVLTSLFSWHAIFFINLPLTALAYLFCRGNVPEVKAEKQEKLDWPCIFCYHNFEHEVAETELLTECWLLLK
jgi:MFS family permease